MTCTAKRHGTRGAYVAGCRCPEARRANTRYAHERKRRTAKAAFGAAPPYTVPVETARDVLQQLEATGWTRRQIEAASGIKRDRLSRIAGGTARPVSTTVFHSTYRRLDDLRRLPTPIAPSALIDGTGTHRRLQALVTIGYPKCELAQMLGIGRSLQLRDRVTKRNADKVAELYQQLQHTPGPSPAARAYGTRHGWLHPGWWDDDTIDDPTHQPHTSDAPHRHDDIDPIAVDLACAGRDVGRTLTRAERITAVLRLVEDNGYSQPAAARQLGIHERQVARDLAQHGARAAS